MFSDGIDDYWILLGLFLEQLTSSHLWEAKNLSKIGVLVSSELSDVSFGNFLQGELLLNFCQMLCSLALTSLFYSLPSGVLLLLSHLLSHLWLMCIHPFSIEKVHQLSEFKLLKLSDFLVFSQLVGSLNVENFSI